MNSKVVVLYAAVVVVLFFGLFVLGNALFPSSNELRNAITYEGR